MAFTDALISRAARMGVPLFAVDMVRTFAVQRSLVRDGKSRDDPGDGLWPHMAYAVDIIHSTHGYNLPDKGWLLLGHLGHEVATQLGIDVRWGRDWLSTRDRKKNRTRMVTFVDQPHWELADWRDRARENPLNE
ncbi:hypothetical protein [Flyfo microvirus Tbat2_95]|nr:hypothetical protein [Flyfo microvirus Tbat2_95]